MIRIVGRLARCALLATLLAATQARADTSPTAYPQLSTAQGVGGPSDTTWSGSGSGSMIAILKAVFGRTGVGISNPTMTLTNTTVTLTAASNTTLIASNATRKWLSICNTGLNPMTLAFGSGAAVVGSGPVIEGASQAGHGGGCWTWDSNTPTNQFNAISASGTTAQITEGN